MAAERHLKLMIGDGGPGASARERAPLTPSRRSPTGLPVQLTSFVGRERELRVIDELLSSGRLVTLTGAGGCGKTRLALEAASDRKHPGGTFWVDLSGVATGLAVAGAVAAALGVPESPLQPANEQVVTHIGTDDALVLLDNCEHVVEATASLVEELLRRCPGLHVLATSREPLGVPGETTYRVPSLPAPGELLSSADELLTYDAARLFVDRARSVRPNFILTSGIAEAVATICSRLDGIPLAIELAAARTRMMSPEQIATGLDDRFRLLTGGARTAVPRQRTLQASVDWSYELLGDAERALFRRLAVFAGGFTLDAAEAVGEGDGVAVINVLELLSQLVDKSLVRVVEGAATRYVMLETIRQYAQERLAEQPEESTAARNRHLLYFLAFAERAGAGLESFDVFDSLDLIEAENDNLVAAASWGEQTEYADETARLAVALRPFWYLRGRAVEGQARLASALSATSLSQGVRARAALGASRLAVMQWDMATAETTGNEALEIARELRDDQLAADALVAIGWALAYSGRGALARERFEEGLALAERGDDGRVLARALFGAGNAPWSAGAWPATRPLFERGLKEARRTGDVVSILDLLHYLFLLHYAAGRDSEAEKHALEGLDLARRLIDPTHESQFTSLLAGLRTRRGEFEEAHAMLDEAKAIAERSGSPFPLAFWLGNTATLARTEGDLAAAAPLLEQVGTTGEALGIATPAVMGNAHSAEVACLNGDLDRAATFAASAARIRASAGGPLAEAAWSEAVVAFTGGDLERAEERSHAALSDALEAEALPNAIEIIETLGCVIVAAGAPIEGARLLGAAVAAWDANGWMRPRTLESRFETTVGAAREAIGEKVFDQAFREGQKLTFEEAVAYARRGRGGRKRPTNGWASLTPTELQVVGLVADGLTNAEIGRRLFMSLGTIKAHLTHVYDKLGVRSRVELAHEFAKRNG